MDKNVKLPSRDEMIELLSGPSNNSDFQDNLRPFLMSMAGRTIDATGIASMLIVSVMAYMSHTDEMMRDYVNKRACEQIDILINDKEIADNAKRIFVEISILCN